LSAGRAEDSSFHIESHAALLQHLTGAEAAGPKSQPHLDAVVVPTIRPWLLGPASALAGDIGCALVVLCTTRKQAMQALKECGTLAGDVLISYVSPTVKVNQLTLLTAEHPENDIEPSCHADIARKRNVGLLLTRLCGWRTVMFLDDDIRGITASAVSAAAALTTRFQAAGFEICHYPDNSVVCHAYRLAGGSQKVFPGGSALLVDVSRNDTPFPSVYNEDWLFLFDAVERHSVAVAGTLSQCDYQPFARPGRAASEEFGDVIAEGLYRLLHEGGAVTDATRGYWRNTLERRFQLIDHIADQLLLQEERAPMTGYALMSLAAARERLAGITELACLSFVRAWRTDVDIWREKLTDLPVLGDLAGAAKYLELPSVDRCMKP
jgi:hypothetical protein